MLKFIQCLIHALIVKEKETNVFQSQLVMDKHFTLSPSLEKAIRSQSYYSIELFPVIKNCLNCLFLFFWPILNNSTCKDSNELFILYFFLLSNPDWKFDRMSQFLYFFYCMDYIFVLKCFICHHLLGFLNFSQFLYFSCARFLSFFRYQLPFFLVFHCNKILYDE